MKKEQLFLVVSLGVAAALVWGSTGRYQTVNADRLSTGRDVPTSAAVSADPRSGLGLWPGGRSQWLEFRIEQRLPRPAISAPPTSSVPWIRPVVWPGISPQYWSSLREPMTVLSRPAAVEKAEAADTSAAEDDEDPEVATKRVAAEDEARKRSEIAGRRARAAVLVYKTGNEQLCRLTPMGADGQDVWKILENWPNVQFKVEELNDDAQSVRAVYVVGPAEIERYATVHLEKNLENEFHEQRIHRGVKANDRQAHLDFAAWIITNLKPTYGVPAVRRAIDELRAAWGLSIDVAVAKQIGEYCQMAYDLESEIRTYLEYLQGSRAVDTPILVALGDAYERSGAPHAARDAFRKAADGGDLEGRVRLGSVLIRLADRASDFDLAYDEFAKGQASGIPTQKARALAGMAHARMATGRFDEALTLANQAKATASDDWMSRMILGAVLYVKGQYAPAEAEFAAAIPLEAKGGSRARSNRGFALLALDKIPEATAEFEQCLKSDPLNYRDPLIGLGEASQRYGDLTKAVDSFTTAQTRQPAYAWTNLRLAAGRLRDGAEQAALEILKGSEGTPGVLQLAPESVDALRLAGLACGALDTPDTAAAVSFLSRAREKEPKNADLTYDLARALGAAARRDDAIALLERETELNSGAAKNDARCLALLAYTYFQADRPTNDVFDALNRANRALGAASLKGYMDDLRDQISRWDQTREIRDDFQQSPSTNIGRGWTETDAAGGVAINADGDRAVFVGKVIPADDRNKQTSLFRAEPLDRFLNAECSLRAGPGFEFVFHVVSGGLVAKDAQGGRRGATGAECGIGRDRNGRLCWFVYPAPTAAAGTGGTAVPANRFLIEPIKDAAGQDRNWPDDDEDHVIRIDRTGDREGVFKLSLDGEVLTPPEGFVIGGLSSQRGKTCMIRLAVDGDAQVQVDLRVDRIVIQHLVAR